MHAAIGRPLVTGLSAGHVRAAGEDTRAGPAALARELNPGGIQMESDDEDNSCGSRVPVLFCRVQVRRVETGMGAPANGSKQRALTACARVLEQACARGCATADSR